MATLKMVPLLKLLTFILIKIKLNNKSGVFPFLANSGNGDFCLLKALNDTISECLTDSFIVFSCVSPPVSFSLPSSGGAGGLTWMELYADLRDGWPDGMDACVLD